MKIYIDDGFSGGHGGGIAVYTDLIASELKARGHQITRANHKLLGNTKNRIARRLLYSFHLRFFLPFFLKKNNFKVAHFTNTQIPQRKNHFTKYISTVHDINPIQFPETVPKSYARYFATMLKNVERNSDCIITVSHSVKKELKKYLNLKDPNIKVCPIGLKQGLRSHPGDNALRKYSVEAQSYFLFVGRLEKRKNLIKLLQGFEKFKPLAKSNGKLVLVGAKGFGADEIVSHLDKSNYNDDVIVTGYVRDYELQELYKHAKAFVFPSVNEGFGIPLLEAMKFNLPIALSKIATNIELVGTKGFYFDPNNETELAEILLALDRRKIQTVDYSDILATFTSEKMVESHIKAYLN